MDPPEHYSAAEGAEDDVEMEMQPIMSRGGIDPDGGRLTRSNNPNSGTLAAKSRRTMATAVARAESVMAMTDDAMKKKKMLLVFLSILLVALFGMVATKGNAVDIEKTVEEGEIEVALHEDVANTDAAPKDEPKSESSAPAHTIDLDGYLPKTMVNSSDYVLPGTENAPPLSAAKGRPYYPIINHFQNRNPYGFYAKKWGYFDLEDPDPKWRGKMRPQPDFASAPNRDVTDFPDGAWQKDQQYMVRFLDEAKKLVNRTIEAIYGEWGVGIPQDGSVKLTDEFMVNRGEFYKWPRPSEQSLDGMTRRFIHHITTGDSFQLVLGGHSAAAGHGAGFNASYVHQAGLVLEPVFAHLGIEFRSKNFAQGGMGTFQQALAGMDLRGKDADMLIWDSSMTEKNGHMTDFFFRQGLLAGDRAPFLYSGYGANPAAFEEIGVSTGSYGQLGYSPITTSEEQAMTLPWAARFDKCESSANALCAAKEYDGKCWVEREDFTPEAKQDELVGGQAKWHPGPKKHRARGRAIALSVLFMLQHALNRWEELGNESGYPIPQEHWHVTDYYNTIKEKVPNVEGCYPEGTYKIGQTRRSLRETNQTGLSGRRLDLEGEWPSRLCNIPMHGRTLWGPRYSPMESSLLSILKPNAYGDVEPGIREDPSYMKGPDYFPPDLAAPWSTPPEPEVNPWEIAGSRRLEIDAADMDQHESENLSNINNPSGLSSAEDEALARGTVNTTALRILAEDPDAIVPGLGFQVLWGLIGVCDGTTHGWCGKETSVKCQYSGAQDNRGSICFNALSGWVVFDVKNVKHGFIGARMEAWRSAKDVVLTDGWEEVNNGGKGNYDKYGLERHLVQTKQQDREVRFLEQMNEEVENDMTLGESSRRRLGGGQSCGGDDYIFEFAINGKIVASWDKAAFCEHYTRTGYNLDFIKFMDDESMTGDFELAMRMSPTNSNKKTVMCITHLYWS